MARIFITGSADGLGQLAAKSLVEQGHKVVLHARNPKRSEEALEKVPGAETVLTADLANIDETKKLAEDANTLGRFDAVIHNAGVLRESDKTIFMVNTLAPYILTCLMQKPKRLVYMSSGMHMSGDPSLKNMENGRASYSDSKLQDILLSFFVARTWPDVYSNAVDPGWVPTKMGGAGAPGDLKKGFETQAWLATSDDDAAKVSGHYFFHKKQKQPLSDATDTSLQDKFIETCERISGIRFPKD